MNRPVGCGLCCICLAHRDFGVPGLSFGRLIPPPAALCVCVTGWVARFARSSNPLLGRSRPRFQSHKAAGADRPWHPVLVRIRSLGCPATGQGSRSAKMFLFCGCLCFPPSGSGPADSTRPVPYARSFPAGTPPCVRACGRVPPRWPRTGHLYLLPHFPMLYQVKFQYGCLIEASSRDEAYSKAIRLLRETPESYVSDVRQAGESKKPVSLMRRLITGQ